MTSRIRKPLAIALVSLVALVLAVVLVPIVSAATSGSPCPLNWFPLSTQSPAIQQQCSQLKQQAQANAFATVQARPYATSVETPYATSLVVTPMPAGYLPPDVQPTQPVDSTILAGTAEG